MEQPQQFTEAQRKAIAALLKPNGSMRESAYERYNDARKELEKLLIEKRAEKLEQLEVIAKIQKGREQLQKLEHDLQTAGFRLDSDGDLSIDYNARALDKAIDTELEKQLGTRAQLAQRFDDAILKVWTVATLDEARKAVDALRSQ